MATGICECGIGYCVLQKEELDSISECARKAYETLCCKTPEKLAKEERELKLYYEILDEYQEAVDKKHNADDSNLGIHTAIAVIFAMIWGAQSYTEASILAGIVASLLGIGYINVHSDYCKYEKEATRLGRQLEKLRCDIAGILPEGH